MKHNVRPAAGRVAGPEWTARPRWRLSRGTEIALGPGKADLLEEIGRRGTISGAARGLGMSYRRAWLLVETMNRCFARPLVATARWRGRGAWLTDEGRAVLALFRRMEAGSLAAARAPLAALTARLRMGPPGRRRRRVAASRRPRARRPVS